MKPLVFVFGLVLLNFSGHAQASLQDRMCGLGSIAPTAGRESTRTGRPTKLPMGTHIVEPEECFRHVLVAKANAPEDRVVNLAELKGRTLTRTFEADEILREEGLETSWLKLPEGYQTVAIRVSARGISQIHPLDYVDVFLTITTNRETTSRLLLQKALVIAVDDAIVDGKKTVTLLLNFEDIAKFELARAFHIDLVVRRAPRSD